MGKLRLKIITAHCEITAATMGAEDNESPVSWRKSTGGGSGGGGLAANNFFAYGQPLNEIFLDLITSAGYVTGIDRAAGADYDFRLDNVFVPVTLGSRNVAG